MARRIKLKWPGFQKWHKGQLYHFKILNNRVALTLFQVVKIGREIWEIVSRRILMRWVSMEKVQSRETNTCGICLISAKAPLYKIPHTSSTFSNFRRNNFLHKPYCMGGQATRRRRTHVICKGSAWSLSSSISALQNTDSDFKPCVLRFVLTSLWMNLLKINRQNLKKIIPRMNLMVFTFLTIQREEQKNLNLLPTIHFVYRWVLSLMDTVETA